MGKVDDRQLPVAQHQQSPPPLRRRCRLINFKCAVVFTLTVAAFVSALFCALPSRHRQAGFDATESIKLTATVQAYFRLHKPVSKLIQQIAKLEYDLNEEIGVPSSKVAILSMHQDGKSNWSDVVFGFLPDPIDINPSSFEILKFPGGITMIPERPAFLMHVPEALFCFSLDSSIHDIKENILELKEQLNSGLHLLPNEAVYIQVTSDHGTTKDPPVTVKASVLSGVGALPQERLKELAHIITGPAENLGLNHSVFGEVKEISLSSFLNHSLRAQTPIPSPSPAPSRGQLYGTGSSPPDVRRSIPPCSNCYASTPTAASDFIPPTPHSLPIADSPESSEINGSPHCGSPDPSVSPSATYFNQVSPSASPSVRSGPDSRCKGM